MTIIAIDQNIAAAERSLKLRNRDADSAFPGLSGNGKLAKLAMPTAVLQTMLRWFWLNFHAKTSYRKVQATARLVIGRSIQAIKIAPKDEMRPQL